METDTLDGQAVLNFCWVRKVNRNMREKRPSGRVFLQHAIFVLGASMMWILLASMIQLSATCQGIPVQSWKTNSVATCLSMFQSHELYIDFSPWRKPLEMLGPRSSSGDGCARHHAGDVLTAFVSLFFPLVQSRVWISRIFLSKGLFGGISRLSNHAPQHQWTIGWFLVELFQSPGVFNFESPCTKECACWWETHILVQFARPIYQTMSEGFLGRAHVCAIDQKWVWFTILYLNVYYNVVELQRIALSRGVILCMLYPRVAIMIYYELNVKQELAPLSDSFLSCGVSTVMITVLRIKNATVWQVFISIDLLRVDLISNCFGCEHSATGSNSQWIEVLLVVASAWLSISINAGTAWHASKLRSPWTRFWKRHGFGSTYGSASVTLEGDWMPKAHTDSFKLI